MPKLISIAENIVNTFFIKARFFCTFPKTKKEKPVKSILNADTDALSPNTTPPGDTLNEPLCSPDPEEHKRILLHNTGIDGLLGVDKETLNEVISFKINDVDDYQMLSTKSGIIAYNSSNVKLLNTK